MNSDKRVEEVQSRLEEHAANYRWRVGNATRFITEKTGIPVSSIEEALSISHNLIGVSGGVKLLDNGYLKVVFAPNAEAHIRRGILQLSENANRVEAEEKATMLVRDYPGLRADFINHQPVPIIPDWITLYKMVKEIEQGGKRSWGQLSPQAQEIAEQLTQFASTVSKHPTPPPIPPKSPLPDGHPWDAPDAGFKEWLIHELRYVPSEVRDQFLERALSVQYDTPQKPTHQGWKTHQHAGMTLLQLETDRLPKYRRALRVAAVLHDVGKKWNMTTPGAHSIIGAKKWQEYAPDWLTEDDKALVTFLIKNHDVLGRLSRGVKEPNYQGAVDPASIREILKEASVPPAEGLEMILALNTADVGSVASLRWTLPELTLAAKMVYALS